ncbi:hypothetical protein ON010_g8630 [Phytophthora cinnamomi]|nr:hypothetical protein ON010_g8630 [Phytophthora cinnamomi]
MPKTAADLQQLLCAINWMRSSIPGYASLAGKLYELLDVAANSVQSRKKKILARVLLNAVGWSAVHVDAVAALKRALIAMVPLAHPKATSLLCLYSDASAEFWGSVVTQIPSEDAGKSLEEQRHAPLAFLSGKFVGASSRWPTVEKEAYAIIESCKRLEYLLLRPEGFTIFTDHRNLLYIFNPEVFDSGIARYQADRLQRWAIALSMFPYAIEHISGEDNAWADLLSRWGASDAAATRGARSVRVAVIAVEENFAISPLQEAGFVWPTKIEVRTSVKGHFGGVIPVEENAENAPPAGVHWDSADELYRDERDRIWVPPGATNLQTRLCVVAHAGAAGHRGVAATLKHLNDVFIWDGMDESVRNFVDGCLHCMRVDGTKVPRPFGEAVHATKPNEVIHFDYLSMPASSNEVCYVLVLKDDMSGFVELVPCSAATSSEVFIALTDWFKRYGVVNQWVSDQGSHFKNTLIELLRRKLGAHHHFVTAYSPWANGTVEVVNRLILRCIKAILSEQRLAISQWPEVLPVVQMALNHLPADRLGGVAPVTAFTALPAQTPVGALIHPRTQELVSLDWVAQKQKDHLVEIQEALTNMHKKLTETSEKKREQARKRQAARSGVVLIKFSLGDFVLVGQVLSRANKLAIQWKGPRRVVKILNDYTFEVQNMVEPFDIQVVHASRMKLYAEAGREVTEDLVQHIIHGEGGHLVERFIECRFGRELRAWEIKVKWFGLDELEASWEPARIMLEDQPGLVEKFIEEHQTDTQVQKMAQALDIRGAEQVAGRRRGRARRP